jgi:multidrug efflux pump subunit AcrA (membrane-fusion protein)
MYANVSILAEEKPNTLLAPRAAVTTIDDQPAVFVVNSNNTVEQREVTTGLFDQDNIEILSGLKEGETVVTAGQSSLTDGAKVEVTNNPGIAE